MRTSYVGPTTLRVTVRAVALDGTALVTDTNGREYEVRWDLARTPFTPAKGELWLIDRSLGPWTFAARYGAAGPGDGGGGGGGSVLRQDFAAQAGQTTFPLLVPNPAVFAVTRNGLDLDPPDYTILGTSLTLDQPALAGDGISVLWNSGEPVEPVAPVVPYGARNRLRNGDFGVIQRGAVFTSFGYTADGWLLNRNGLSISQTAILPNTAADPLRVNGAAQRLIISVGGADADSDYYLLQQSIEDVRTLAGKTVTLSFLGAAPNAAYKIGVQVIQDFGLGGGASAPVYTHVGTITPGTTVGRHSLTFVIPDITGKVIGTNSNFVALRLWFTAGNAYAAEAGYAAHQNGTWNITDVQLEEGSVATPFERLDPATQLAWCQRYFWRFNAEGGTTTPVGAGHGTSATGGLLHLAFPTTMRKAPQATYGTPGSFTVFTNTSLTATSMSTNRMGASAVLINLGVASGLGVNVPFVVFVTAATGTIDFSAEF